MLRMPAQAVFLRRHANLCRGGEEGVLKSRFARRTAQGLTNEGADVAALQHIGLEAMRGKLY